MSDAEKPKEPSALDKALAFLSTLTDDEGAADDALSHAVRAIGHLARAYQKMATPPPPAKEEEPVEPIVTPPPKEEG